ncbi:hypothetical protein [Pseudoalteromonas denitrificans]|uniref:FlxA-like protein n=1 Tax=Pseudoalteromonas denitrificans DSM 6059 TaxID=1123010 RepID=A0A1I1RK52_9GAMM|nr:hypothetical protein [Pseudoalteromonas denitrificans]SFD34522.1 hypothetical protein SAMN02745724_04261 [Pseudoalteromonas denitrificans DSM 6059]
MNINALNSAAQALTLQKTNFPASNAISNDTTPQVDRYTPSNQKPNNENTYEHLANKAQKPNQNSEKEKVQPMTDNEIKAMFADLRQGLLDQRLGIDREKIEEIKVKIEELQREIAKLKSRGEPTSELEKQLENLYEQLDKEYQKGREHLKDDNKDENKNKINISI